MDFIKITAEEIDVSNSLSYLTNPSCGATACFIGTTRDNFGGKSVTHLSYEVYLPMAMKELHRIRDSMKSKWPVRNVVLIHRIGAVLVSEVSVLVAASSVHRKEALEAVSYGIDCIKADVPIWKREEYSDGTSSWKANCECERVIKDTECPVEQ